MGIVFDALGGVLYALVIVGIFAFAILARGAAWVQYLLGLGGPIRDRRRWLSLDDEHLRLTVALADLRDRVRAGEISALEADRLRAEAQVEQGRVKAAMRRLEDRRGPGADWFGEFD